jgi:hypothetical protein
VRFVQGLRLIPNNASGDYPAVQKQRVTVYCTLLSRMTQLRQDFTLRTFGKKRKGGSYINIGVDARRSDRVAGGRREHWSRKVLLSPTREAIRKEDIFMEISPTLVVAAIHSPAGIPLHTPYASYIA